MFNITKAELVDIFTDKSLSVDVYTKDIKLSIQYCEDSPSVEESIGLVFDNPNHDFIMISEWVEPNTPHKEAEWYKLIR